MLDDLANWLELREYESVAQIKGAMSHKAVEDASAFERANYIRILEKYKADYAAP